MRVTLGMIAEWAGSPVIGAGADTAVCGASIDSRTIAPGQLFVAIKGPNFDGHAFVEKAFALGAAGALVSNPDALKGHPGVVVPDVLAALGKVAHRFRWQPPVLPWVAVTGSNGKTTTRQMVATILRTKGVVCTPEKNYNNLIGMPLTILNCPDNAWAGVVELGTNAPGEIKQLTDIAVPTVSIVTCVAPAHLEGLGSVEGVAREKAAIYSRLPKDGVAIFPASDPSAPILQQAIPGNRASFSSQGKADMTAENVTAHMDGLRFRVRGVEFFLPMWGRHNVDNCLAALLAAEHLGIGLKDAAEALRSFVLVDNRLQMVEGQGGVRILDDVYNANPGSMRKAVETLLELPATRRVAILGDMLELGKQSAKLHAELGKWLSTAGADVVLVVGRESLPLAETAACAGARTTVRHFRTVQALMGWLPATIQPGDLVLVKGSRGMQMERVVKTLQHLVPADSGR